MRNDNKSMIDQFADLSVEAFTENMNEFYEIVGIDGLSYMKGRMNHIKQLNLKTMASQQREENEKKRIAAERILQILKSGDDGKISKLKQRMSAKSMNVAFFHNVEKLNQQDLESIMEDKNLLDIIEDLDKMENE